MRLFLRIVGALLFLSAVLAGCISAGHAQQAPTGNNGPSTYNAGNGYGAGIPGPTHTATPSPAPTAAVAYAPTYIYFGTAGGGGGGDMTCNTGTCSTYLLTGTGLSQINVRYVEGGASSGTSGGTSAAINACLVLGTYYCHPINYNKINNVDCTEGAYSVQQYNAVDAHDTASSDVGFIHVATPAPAATPPYWASVRVGQTGAVLGKSGSCANNTRGTYFDPANSGGYLAAGISTNYFTGVVNGNTNVWTRWDNESLVNISVEYGLTGSFAGLDSYIKNTATLFNGFAYMQGFNNGGTGGDSTGYMWNNPGTSGSTGHIAFACNNGVCNDIDDWCAGNTNGHFGFFQFERPASVSSLSTYDGTTRISNNIPYIFNTISHAENDPGCANVDFVFLDPTHSGKVDGTTAGDWRYMRDISFALRIFTTRGNYTAAPNQAASINQQYGDCTGCIGQVTSFPESGLQFVPLDSGMGAYSGTVKDGNGCASGDSGGAHTFTVYCDTAHNDDNGTPGAVYARAGTCYKWGQSIGTCIALFSQVSTTAETIQDNWCKIDGLTQGCSAYPYYWHYNGTGPSTCYKDQGSNLGTSSATCTSNNLICPAANGCMGYWGELPWNGTATLPNSLSLPANTLGYAPGPLDVTSYSSAPTGSNPTFLRSDPFVLLLSQ